MNPSTKAVPMTKEETILLIQLVAESSVIINKSTNATYNRLKEQAWQALTEDFNSSVSSPRRSPAQLRLKWENLKKAARKRRAYRISEIHKTGGDNYFPPDEVLDTVALLLDNTHKDIDIVVNSDGPDDGGDGTLSLQSGGSNEREELHVTQIIEPPRLKHKNFVLNRASGSLKLAKRKMKMEDEKHKTRIFRDNALAQYLMAKKRSIELENEEKEINIAKLKLELEMVKFENARLLNKSL